MYVELVLLTGMLLCTEPDVRECLYSEVNLHKQAGVSKVSYVSTCTYVRYVRTYVHTYITYT